MREKTSEALQKVSRWFAENGRIPFSFQLEAWKAYLAGHNGLVHSATGTGKTFAVWIGPLIEALADGSSPGLKVLWITPLRALAADTVSALAESACELSVPWRIESRTGDTPSHLKAKQKEILPEALVTTPESLSLLLSYPGTDKLFADLRCIVVDEWHELLSTKRGVQTELCLARLRRWRPDVRIWGISATLGNLDQAAQTLFPSGGVLVRGELSKEIVVDCLLPDRMERFPWAGHMGKTLLPKVIEAIDESKSCLLFTNTRSQSEIWFQAILEARPDWKGHIEIHHGSLDRDVRDAVERGIKLGKLRAVVCTSSLDLGVDFAPVDRVLQIGSPKGVSRLLQRAGRSGHQPGMPSRITCVPTFALELIDVAAVRDAALAGRIDQRVPLERPLDVLSQHLVTIAAGGGFDSEGMLAEVRSAHAYRDLTEGEWEWTINFITRGGESLKAYPEYQRVDLHRGRYLIRTADIAKRHRMNIGSITSDAAVNIQFLKGPRLGTVEESFVARLKPGDRFVFSGHVLKFIRIKDMTAYVKLSRRTEGIVPRWMGGRLPLSNELAQAVRIKLQEASDHLLTGPEMRKMAPLFKVQKAWSAIPKTGELLIERVTTREGHHLFFYPVEGRLVHEGLAALFAYRFSLLHPITFSMACNDYGFELLSDVEAPLEKALAEGLFSTHNLDEDIRGSLNSVEMAKRQFREIARVAGLLFEGFPGNRKGARQVQASSGLFYDVFRKYDPDHLLLRQADREVLEKQLERMRLFHALIRLQKSVVLITDPPRPTPLAFPIIIDLLRESVSSESFEERIKKMTSTLEAEADQILD
jgi:ATP-dependent Lhr-like helicase